MDINGQRYFLLREAEEFANQSSRLTWNSGRWALTLAQNQDLRLSTSDPVAALAVWNTARPLGLDSHAQHARINGNTLEYNAGNGFLPLVDGDLRPVRAPFGDFDDLHLGGDDLLAASYSDAADLHGALLFHLRRRWVMTIDFPERVRRVWIDADDTLWCLGSTRLFACSGQPLPHAYDPQSARFEPAVLNPTPLKVYWHRNFAGGDLPLALCAAAEQLYVLVHQGNGRQTVLRRRRLPDAADWQRFELAAECPFAIDLRPLDADRLALLVPPHLNDPVGPRDCLIVQLDNTADAPAGLLVRERYPLLSIAEARFVASGDGKLRYQSLRDGEEENPAGYQVEARELLPLRRPRYYTAAMATLFEPLDSGAPDTVWHRIYMEGQIPPGCRLRLYAKVFNHPDERNTAPFFEQPEWLWCRHRSDQPFGIGLVESRENHSGLFELLLQRTAGPVRRLSGRYLLLRLQFESNSQHTPAVHALKVYYPRYCYQETYLPEHFRQEWPVDPALDGERANGADVRERLLAAFEGVLTPLEGTISCAEILLNPEATPAQHLPWLAELFGQNLPEGWPVARQRRWLKESGQLQRWRGTYDGICLALDIASDGAVARGEVVIVENFRLRRTMATVLGLDMDDSEHPLTLGTGVSGNSLVGDSLILADRNAREFLALFAPELAGTEDKAIVENFFDVYAHKVTVLLHGRARSLRSGIESMLREQMPAHLQWQVMETDHPFVLGLSPLLSVHTYLEPQPSVRRVVLNDTWLGREGMLANVAAFSPQDVNARPGQ